MVAMMPIVVSADKITQHIVLRVYKVIVNAPAYSCLNKLPEYVSLLLRTFLMVRNLPPVCQDPSAKARSRNICASLITVGSKARIEVAEDD